VALVTQAGARQQRASRSAGERVVLAGLLQRIAAHRDETWRWQRVMHRPPTPYEVDTRRMHTIAYGKRVLGLWHRRAAAAKRRALNPPHRNDWLCIHGYEAAWDDGTAPYYGGLQMDLEFQATYGRDLLRRKGTADHWTVLEQMWVAERAFRTRRFWPWPNTARACGLL
jgi:hypothetical protein